MRFRTLTQAVLACAGLSAVFSGAPTAWAAPPVGQPYPGGIAMQEAATDVAREVHAFHNEVLWIITAVTIFVMLLLLWVMIRYNKAANPVPKKFSHNTLVEILWTAVPVLILVLIAYKSFPLLYKQDVFPKVAESEVVDVKVYGRQWYWSYVYGTGDEALEYDSNLLPEDMIDTSKGHIPQLSVDNPMVAPVGKYVRLSISATDVIHSFAMPAFAIKVDAVPGRLNQLWFKTDRAGVYYGQCSELCGIRHAYMPIELRVLPQDQYAEWQRRATASLSDARAYLDQVQPLSAAQVASVK